MLEGETKRERERVCVCVCVTHREQLCHSVVGRTMQLKAERSSFAAQPVYKDWPIDCRRARFVHSDVDTHCTAC